MFHLLCWISELASPPGPDHPHTDTNHPVTDTDHPNSDTNHNSASDNECKEDYSPVAKPCNLKSANVSDIPTLKDVECNTAEELVSVKQLKQDVADCIIVGEDKSAALLHGQVVARETSGLHGDAAEVVNESGTWASSPILEYAFGIFEDDLTIDDEENPTHLEHALVKQIPDFEYISESFVEPITPVCGSVRESSSDSDIEGSSAVLVQVSEDQESVDSKDGTKQALPREQDLVSYTSLGTDYGRKQYETKVEKEKAAKEGKVLVPVNRQVVEKVAPPEITKSVRAMFETGQLPDIHEVKKTKIDEPPPESGIYENKPEELQDVVRCTDINMAGEELKKGMTKDLLDEWSTKGQENGPTEPKEMVNVAEDEGKILENEPSVRTDVIRETDDDPTEQIVLQKGHAMNLREKFLKRDDGPKERKAIKLVEDESAPTVFENTPQQLEGVVRATDDTDQTSFERGKAKNLKGYWSSRTDDVEVKREAIKIDRETGPVVLENQPEVLEGVVRASDVPDSEKQIQLDSGRTKNMASMWSRKSEENTGARKQPIKLDLANAGPSVIENEPIELEGVVRCDTVVEDVIPGNRGRTKDIAGKFLKEEEEDRRPRQMIEIEKASGPIVLENEPAPPPEGVVRSDYVNDAMSMDTGHTKNLVNRWVDKENEVLSPKTSSGGQGKPKWIQEIEAAKDSGVYENNPTANEGTVKESDIPEDEKQPLIPEEYTRTMRNRWKQMEVDASSTKIKENSELVRFTPPREITPPPVHQQEFQSIQKLTLTPKLQQQQQQQQQQSQQNGTMQNGQDPTAQQQYYSQQQLAGDGSPPAQTVKSSTVLVLK